MDDRVLRLLEFDKIRDRLAQHTAFSASRSLALALRPAAEFGEADRLQQATEDAATVLRLKPSFSIGGARDIRQAVQTASLDGLLEAETLLEIAATLAAAASVRETLTRLADVLPVLSEIASDLVPVPIVETDIVRCIGRRGELLDSASPQLARIRLEGRQAHESLRSRLDAFLASPTGKLVLQEPIVTLREGRYVVPVKADYRGQLRGIIHDTSASGATVFMEPLEIVDLNNRWRELQFEEQREAERILRRLSAEVGENAGAIVADVDILATIDLHVAMARYGRVIQAIRPALLPPERRWQLKLHDARHPLLGERVVPLSVTLGGDYFILVITGPNTGGKTVALKTVGLLTLMAMAGMPVPAAAGSSLVAFTDVQADIGDEQSIEQSLSTFSSHIHTIARILRSAGPATLVLLDEIGAGTDPAEGSALARAILAFLARRRVPAITTTHYSEIKVYAHMTPGVQNASVEFDVETLAPTYRLIIGTPGASNALAIASRIGLAHEIIEDARSHLAPEDIEIERLLADMQQERDALAAERARLAAATAAAEGERDRLATAFAGIAGDRDRILEEARAEVLAEADSMLRSLQRAAAVANQPAAIAEAAAEVAQARQAMTRRTRERPRAVPRVRPLKIGDPVRITSLNSVGDLVSISETRNEAEVQLGAFKAKVRASDLEPLTAREVSREHRRAHLETRPTVDLDRSRETPGLQLDLRGRRVDEVYGELDRYLNDAYLSAIPQVRVVHGKGTGALRQVVRDSLARHPLVRTWEAATQREGGEGATVATLALE